MNGDRAARSALAARWADEAAGEYVGRPLVEAEAAAHAAGLGVKIEPATGWTTQEFGIGRVRIAVDEHDLVTRITAG